MTERALELLAIDPNDEKKLFILDVGCGSGLSGEILSEEQHYWVGVDISSSMLAIARERECIGDLFLQDIGEGFGFRPGTFDACISISVIQWLCNADKSSHSPHARLSRFFNCLFTSLQRGARAVFQFYPSNASQSELIMSAAIRAGFVGGLVVDFPNSSKAKKYFLVLDAGWNGKKGLPAATGNTLQGMAKTGVEFSNERIRVKTSRVTKRIKDKEWVLKKKETRRLQGKSTASDSKFTARKRKTRF